MIKVMNEKPPRRPPSLAMKTGTVIFSTIFWIFVICVIVGIAQAALTAAR